MAWQNRSNRIVPTDWARRKRAVQQRDQGRCHACGHHGATDVDHIINVAAGGTHDLTNLALIHADYCPTCGKRCHKDKTHAESQAAKPSRRRPPEQHPGIR